MNSKARDLIEDALAELDAAGDDESFSELVERISRNGAFDKSKHLRYGDWSDIDFSGSNLNGFDFTGAKLVNCRFEMANTMRAVFERVVTDVAEPHSMPNKFRTAIQPSIMRDWDDEANVDWMFTVSLSRKADDYFHIGSVFMDVWYSPEMVVVPAGEFLIGSPDGNADRSIFAAEQGRLDTESPKLGMTVQKPFAVSRFPITNFEWNFFCYATMSGNERVAPGIIMDLPAVAISWHEATDYCKWLSAMTGQNYRLLTEAEWEYVCRAGTDTAFNTGDDITPAQAQYSESRKPGLKPVGTFPCNAWGLFDMHGNVGEWCQDVWRENYLDPVDPNPSSNAMRVVRGGAFDFPKEFCRSAYRGCDPADDRFPNIGFRVARDLRLPTVKT